MADYLFSNNTYSKLVKDNPKDRIEVEIGDSKEPSIVLPQEKISRWDNESNVSIRLLDFDEYSVTQEADKIILGNEKLEAHFYPLTEGEGGQEFEITLKEKPLTNVIRFSLVDKDVEYFYQPPLTQQEIDEGAERPENVVGSYAVYHKTKGGMNDAAGMEYKVGKAFHIYRPKVTDANGVETWGELNIDESSGILTVTIDQTWLDNAVYPVVVDPTFGYTSVGASTSINFGLDNWYGSLFTSPADADTVSEINAHVKTNAAGGTANFKGMIVLHNDLTIIASGVGAVSEQVTDTSNWRASTYSSVSISPSTDYVLSAVVGNFSVATKILPSFDTGDTDQRHSELDNNYATPTNPSTIFHGTQKFSIYATYTAVGTTTSTTTTSSSTSTTTTSSSTTTTSSSTSTTSSTSTSTTTTSSSTSTTTTSSSTSTSSTTSTSTTTTSSSTTTTSSSTSTTTTSSSTSTSTTTTSSSTSTTTTSSSTSTTTTSSSTSTSSSTTTTSTSTTTSSSTSTTSSTSTSSSTSTTTTSSSTSTTTSTSTSTTTTSSSTSTTTTTSSSTTTTSTSSSTTTSTSTSSTTTSTSTTTTVPYVINVERSDLVVGITV